MTVPDFRLPAEWEPQAGVLLAWPHAGTDWAPRLAAVESTYVALVAAIARFEPVVLCVADAAVRQRAEALLREANVDLDRVRRVEIDYDDTWLRDSGPITLCGADGFVLADFRFTGWGGKFEGSRDDRLVEGLLARGLFVRASHRRIDWALEGGAIESDGAGTVLTTWRCLHQRHPTQSREHMEEALRDGLAASRVSWLEHGYLEGDDTDAHIDTLARFAPGDAIVYQACDDATDPPTTQPIRTTANLRAWRRHWPRCARCRGVPTPCTPCPGHGRSSTKGGALRRPTPTSSSSTAPCWFRPTTMSPTPPRRGSSRVPIRGARSCRYPADR